MVFVGICDDWTKKKIGPHEDRSTRAHMHKTHTYTHGNLDLKFSEYIITLRDTLTIMAFT